eukprot:SAG31_NODE_3987_length_3683_cov_4.328962_2_plen_224_part_00
MLLEGVRDIVRRGGSGRGGGGGGLYNYFLGGLMISMDSDSSRNRFRWVFARGARQTVQNDQSQAKQPYRENGTSDWAAIRIGRAVTRRARPAALIFPSLLVALPCSMLSLALECLRRPEFKIGAPEVSETIGGFGVPTFELSGPPHLALEFQLKPFVVRPRRPPDRSMNHSSPTVDVCQFFFVPPPVAGAARVQKSRLYPHTLRRLSHALRWPGGSFRQCGCC